MRYVDPSLGNRVDSQVGGREGVRVGQKMVPPKKMPGRWMGRCASGTGDGASEEDARAESNEEQRGDGG